MLLRCAFFYISILYACVSRGTFIWLDLVVWQLAIWSLLKRSGEKKNFRSQMHYDTRHRNANRVSDGKRTTQFYLSILFQWDTSSKKQLRKSNLSEHYFCRKSHIYSVRRKTKQNKTQTSTITAFALISLWRLLSIVNVNLSSKCEYSEHTTNARKWTIFTFWTWFSLGENDKHKTQIIHWFMIVAGVFRAHLLCVLLLYCIDWVLCVRTSIWLFAGFFFGLIGRFSHEKSQITENGPDLE